MDLIVKSDEYRIIDRHFPLLIFYGPWGVWSCGAGSEHWSEMINLEYQGSFERRHLMGYASAAISVAIALVSGALVALVAATVRGLTSQISALTNPNR